MACNGLWGKNLRMGTKMAHGETAGNIFKVDVEGGQTNSSVFSEGGITKEEIKSEGGDEGVGF